MNLAAYVRVTHPDVFEQIVGVPLDDWIAANTVEDLQELLDRRDNPPPVETFERHQDECWSAGYVLVDDLWLGTTDVLCDCGATFRRVGK